MEVSAGSASRGLIYAAGTIKAEWRRLVRKAYVEQIKEDISLAHANATN